MPILQSVQLSTLKENDSFTISRNNVPTSTVFTLLHRFDDGMFVIESKKGLPRLINSLHLVFLFKAFKNV